MSYVNNARVAADYAADLSVPILDLAETQKSGRSDPRNCTTCVDLIIINYLKYSLHVIIGIIALYSLNNYLA